MSAVLTNGGGVAVRDGASKNGRGGKFISTDNLTALQLGLIRRLVRNGGDVPAAAIAAGYASAARGYEALQLEKVQRALHAERERYINQDLANLAAGTMKALLVDKGTPAATRYQAARWCLEQAGHAKDAEKPFDPDKPLTDYTLDELQAFINAGAAAVEQLKDQRARVIDITPDSETDSDGHESAQDSAQSDADADILD